MESDENEGNDIANGICICTYIFYTSFINNVIKNCIISETVNIEEESVRSEELVGSLAFIEHERQDITNEGMYVHVLLLIH